MSPPGIVVGVQESLIFLVNSHILKMAMMLKSSAEYNIGEPRSWKTFALGAQQRK